MDNNNTVYIIMKGSYSDRHICAVTLDKERAEQLKRLYNNPYAFDEPYITEYKLDETIKLNIYQVYFKQNGEFIRVCREEYGFCKIGTINIEDYYYDDNDEQVYSVYVEAADEDHARKIAQDMLAEYKARKEGIT